MEISAETTKLMTNNTGGINTEIKINGQKLEKVTKRRKLQCYGHDSRSSGLAKTILQDTVKGRRRQGAQGRGEKTTSGNGQAWSSASPRGQWRTGIMEKTVCRIICGAPTTLAVKGLMRRRRRTDNR